MMNNVLSVLRLAMQNAWRWRWRLLAVSGLVMISFSLHVLYGAYLSGISSSGSARADIMNTKHYDVMVQPGAEQRVKSREELPSPRYQRKLYGHGEEAVGLSVSSQYGDLELLGLHRDSAFFRFDTAELQGRTLQRRGELLLPRGFAELEGLGLGDQLTLSRIEDFRLRQVTLTLVGIYEDDFDLPPALVVYEDATVLQAEPKANRYLLNYNRTPGEATLDQTLEWLAAAYPGAVLLSNHTTVQLASSLLQRILQPGNGLLILIFLFMGIGVLTVALMTFLERRKEMAALKSVGISNSQTVTLLAIEYSGSLVFGLTGGVAVVVLLAGRLPWLQGVSGEVLWSLGWQAGWNSLLVLILALLFPVMTARVATVNQLLFARVIPLWKKRVNHLVIPEGWLLLREQEENVRFLKLPTVENEPDFICFKEVGDTVKRGEVVAAAEALGGLSISEWEAFCDGTVVEYNRGGLFAIRPHDPQAPFYPYPSNLIEEEKRKAEKVEHARLEARKEMGASK